MKKTEEYKKEQNPLDVDLRALSVFRIFLALLVIIDLIGRSQWLGAHYSDLGILPREAHLKYFGHQAFVSFHLISGHVNVMAILFVINGIFAVMFLLGYKTRLANIMLFILMASLHVRNPMITQGGDVQLRLMLFFSIFMPMARFFSIEAAMDPGGSPSKLSFFNIGTFSYKLQILYIYVFAALLKTGPEWKNGTATWFALNLDHFSTPFGKAMLAYPELLKIGTHGVWYWEALGPFLLVFPYFRKYLNTAAVFGFALMHICFGMALEIGLFRWIGCVALIPFLPKEFWDFLAEKMKPKRNDIILYYDGDCGFCRKVLLIIRTFFGLKSFAMVKAQTDPKIEKMMLRENSWVVKAAENEYKFAFDALSFVLTQTPFFGFLFRPLRLGLFQLPGKAFYYLIANNRRVAGKLTSIFEYKERDNRNHLLATLVCVLAILYITWWNLGALPKFKYKMNYLAKYPGITFQLEQYWDMFAPRPMSDDGWYVMPGKLRNGKQVDIFTKSDKVSWEKPELVSAMYPFYRWRKYLVNIWMKKYAGHRLYYGRYLCRTWNHKARAKEEQLMTFSIYYMKEDTFADRIGKPEKVNLWNHNCWR